MQLLDGMILSGRLVEFVSEFIKLHNEDTETQTLWEMWLHKVFDQSWNDFMISCGKMEPEPAASKEELEATVRDSIGIISGFSPS